MNSLVGWMLVIAGVLLLAVPGRLEMLAVSLPLAAVVAYGFSRIGQRSRTRHRA